MQSRRDDALDAAQAVKRLAEDVRQKGARTETVSHPGKTVPGIREFTTHLQRCLSG